MSLKLDGGWARMKLALKPADMTKRLKQELRKATKLNAKLAEKRIREAIRGGGFEKNAALTVSIKGSTKPLADRGQLFQFITSKVVGDATLFVGILRTDEHYNIAAALHQGVSIKVTPAMRGMFFVLYQASIGKKSPSELTGRAAELFSRMPNGWLPLRESTKFIVIPPRPFIKIALSDASFQQKIQGNWRMAIQAAMKPEEGGGA